MVIGPSGELPRIELALETADGREIPNEQIRELSQFDQHLAARLDTEYGGYIHHRSEPTPRYNCHGLAFAARRTGVFEAWVIQRILEDDRYVRIETAQVLPGDIVLYYDESGDIEHSGVVIESPAEQNLSMPLVCSKWGKFAEVIHLAHRCPYNAANLQYFRIVK
jgi:hypothetical protein